MQIGSAEFIAVIAALITIAGGAVMYAINAFERKREAQSSLKEAQQTILSLNAEIVRLKQVIDKHEPADTDSFTKPLNYPKTYVA